MVGSITRLERLKQLMDDYGMDVEDYDLNEEEDVRGYFSGDREPARWCCITRHGEKVFFLPAFESLDSAKHRAVVYAHDDREPRLYAESPVAVVNLDTYEKHVTSFRWKKL